MFTNIKDTEMTNRFILVLLCVVAGMVWSVNGAECRTYTVPGGVCSNYINYDVFLDTNVSFDIIEESLAPLRPLLGPGSLAPSECADAYAKWACSLAYPKCNQIAGPSFPCKETCLNVTQLCASLPKIYTPQVVAVLNASSVPPPPQVPTNSDCAASMKQSINITLPSLANSNQHYPTAGSCFIPTKVSNPGPNCFSPLIVDEKWSQTNGKNTSNSEFCQNGCCISCPQIYSLYKPNQLNNGFLATQIVRAISSVASFIMLLSYLVLPGKRSHPSVLILFASLAIFLYSSNVFFSIGNPIKVQCADKFTKSTQDNNVLCGIQGALLVFSSHATSIWIAAIILNLHIHTVWNSNFLSTKYFYIHMICWGIPLALTIISLCKHVIKYEIAGLCLIDVKEASNIIFYPMAVWIVPSFIIHMATFIYIAKISAQAESDKSGSTQSFVDFISKRNHVLQAVKIQWRALLLAIVLLITVMCYWLFYFVELKRVASDPAKFTSWLTCVALGQGQEKCAKLTQDLLPSFGLLISAEMSVSGFGIYLIVIFANWSLLSEWSQWFSAKLLSRRKLEVPDQFFAI